MLLTLEVFILRLLAECVLADWTVSASPLVVLRSLDVSSQCSLFGARMVTNGTVPLPRLLGRCSVSVVSCFDRGRVFLSIFSRLRIHLGLRSFGMISFGLCVCCSARHPFPLCSVRQDLSCLGFQLFRRKREASSNSFVNGRCEHRPSYFSLLRSYRHV